MSDTAQFDFQLLAESSVDLIMLVGIDRVMHYVSPSSVQLLGWEPSEMTERLADDFIFADDLPMVHRAAAEALSPGGDKQSVTMRMVNREGRCVWMEVNARVRRDEKGAALNFVVVMRDITQRQMLVEKLATLALTDGLTGLFNRRAFDEALEREWQRTLREGTEISLLLLDIDHFKRYNDQYGHQVGDDCLRAVSVAVQRAVPVPQMVFRYGGEEIVILLPSSSILESAEVGNNVLSAVKSLNIKHDGNPAADYKVSISMGLATALARPGGTMRMRESLLQAADTALYKAERDGRNRMVTSLLMAAPTQPG